MVTVFLLIGLLLPVLLIGTAIGLEWVERRLNTSIHSVTSTGRCPTSARNVDEELEMNPEKATPERHLRVQPEPDWVPVSIQRSNTFEHRSRAARAAEKETLRFTEELARAGWSMRLHALLGEEVAHAVGAGILTLAEAEVLLARIAVVVDQAVGASES